MWSSTNSVDSFSLYIFIVGVRRVVSEKFVQTACGQISSNYYLIKIVMTIIIFLVDTSASMNQKTYLGTSILDVAKGAIETFLKLRARDVANRRLDRYMLLSFEDAPNNVKAGWKEPHSVLMQELRGMCARGLTNFGVGLGTALNMLNVNRLQSGIDGYGHGRFPYWLEPAVIIAITDGAAFTTPQGIENMMQVPVSTLVGSELTSEPFRWDQRIYSLVLRLPGHPPSQPFTGGLIPSDCSNVDLMCDVTGGRSYCITSDRMLNQCIESLLQKVQSGVVLKLEKHGADPTPIIHSEPNAIIEPLVDKLGEAAWHKTRRMLLVPRTAARGFMGHWPVPESFWPDNTSSNLPPRSAHPVILFKCDPREPMVLENFPFDKYELEPSPLTQYILERKQPTVCWQIFLANSGRHEGLGLSFGYIKASSNLMNVNMVVMPYNYPVLLPLLEELKTNLRGRPSPMWKAKFEKYLKTIPMYYYNPLRRALKSVNLSQIMPDREDPQVYAFSVQAYLSRVKHKAKEEFEKFCAAVTNNIQTNAQASTSTEPLSVTVKVPQTLVLPSEVNAFSVNMTVDSLANMKKELVPVSGFKMFIGSDMKGNVKAPTAPFHNPFDIGREKLLHQIDKMRLNLRQQLNQEPTNKLQGGPPGAKLKIQHLEGLHNLAISQMGNYQDYLSRIAPPLRQIEATPQQLHAFGNPFKIDKNKMLVDEADLDVLIGSSDGSQTGSAKINAAKRDRESNSARGNLKLHLPPKRKPGPLKKDYRFKRRRNSASGSFDSDASSIASDVSLGNPLNYDVIHNEDRPLSPLFINDIHEYPLQNGINKEQGEELVSPGGSQNSGDEQILWIVEENKSVNEEQLLKLRNQLSLIIRNNTNRDNIEKIVEAIEKAPDFDQASYLWHWAEFEASRFKDATLKRKILHKRQLSSQIK